VQRVIIRVGQPRAQVLTNLSEYSDHGVAVQPEAEPEAAQAEEEASDVTADGELVQTALCSERRIRVQRTYSDFVSLRTALLRLPGARELPELPGKLYFSGPDEATLQKRRAAFQRLLAHIGADEALACAPETCAFLSGASGAREGGRVASRPVRAHLLLTLRATFAQKHADVTVPDYAKVHADALQRMRDVLALPAADWLVQYRFSPKRTFFCVAAHAHLACDLTAAVFATRAARSKNDIEIAMQRVESSNIWLIRSSVRVPLPVDVTHAHYTVRCAAEQRRGGTTRDAASSTQTHIMGVAPACLTRRGCAVAFACGLHRCLPPAPFSRTQETANWTKYTPDATFTEVERVSPHAAVLCCVYQLPLISNRASLAARRACCGAKTKGYTNSWASLLAGKRRNAIC
jgi:hypothetical protein